MNPIQPGDRHRRTVLCLSGHDPSGGAGLHADLLAVHAQGAHALSVPTVLTVQDTLNVAQVKPVSRAHLERAARCLIQDIPIHAIKVGLLGNASQVKWAAGLIKELGVPAVVDPVLRAGGGKDLADDAMCAALIQDLLPVTTLLTPNVSEARRLAPAASAIEDCALSLLQTGCRHVLVTGGDEPDDATLGTVHNHWFSNGALQRRFDWPRWPARFRGAGCTLASAIAARLAQGDTVAVAIESAQSWTHKALGKHYAIGHGRAIPLRAPERS